MLQDGWQLTGNSAKIVLHKQGLSIIFDIVVPTTTGQLYCLKFIRHGQEATCIGIKNPERSIALEEFHTRLGHMNVAAVKKVAAALAVELTTKTMKTCEACARIRDSTKLLVNQRNKPCSRPLN